MTVFLFSLRSRNRGMATEMLPLFVSKANSHGKIPVAIPRFLLRKEKVERRRSIRRRLVFLLVLLPFIPFW